MLKKVDVDNTIRSRVTARNADGAHPVDVGADCRRPGSPGSAPSGCDGAAPIPIANVALPNRLLIDGQSISPTVVGRSTQRSRSASA